MNSPSFPDHLTSVVNRATDAMRSLPEDQVNSAYRPGGWTRREVLLHLLDSAMINYQRFVRVSEAEETVFETYDQDRWTTLASTSSLEWFELVTLWMLLNRHLASVVSHMRASALHRETTCHNFDRIAWRPVSPEARLTPAFLVRDYGAHLAHHLGQILGPDAPTLDPEAGTLP